MEKPLSNYWRKRVPHKKYDYVDDPVVIWGHNSDLPLVEKTYIYEGQITPNRMIKDKNVYEITHLDEQYLIHGFSVMTQNEMVHIVSIFGFHPNRDPDTNIYCMPDYKKGVKYDSTYYERLLTNIKTYYLDDCFFRPGKAKVQYRKMKSIAMKLNKGD